MSDRESSDHALRLGTRGSPLALWQARWVAERIGSESRQQAELVVVKTTAEKFPDDQLTQMGTGIFTKELDDALLQRDIDLAVHSLKDVPSQHHPELIVAAVPERESPWDAFISADGTPLDRLPQGARIGTSSPRRQAQLIWHRRDLQVEAIRGNVQTRIRKVKELGLAGTVLAHAGLKRLNQEKLITEILSRDLVVPAVAQGALAVITRRDDAHVRAILQRLNHEESHLRITAERAYLRRLRGGCQVPAGAIAEYDAATDRLHIVAVLAASDGSWCHRGERSGGRQDAEDLGRALADELLEKRDGGAEGSEGPGEEPPEERRERRG